MSELIEQRFKRVGEDRYVYAKRQVIYAILGCIGFCVNIWGFVYTGIDLFGLFWFVILSVCFLAIIALGLYTVTSEIDLTSRKIRITRRTILGQKSTNEFPIDKIVVNALRMGVTDANPHDVWIAKAGINTLTEDGRMFNVAIFSHETSDLDERNRVMIELYHFFFPDSKSVGPGHIITNGSQAEVLSDAEKVAWENENAATFEVKL